MSMNHATDSEVGAGRLHSDVRVRRRRARYRSTDMSMSAYRLTPVLTSTERASRSHL